MTTNVPLDPKASPATTQASPARTFVIDPEILSVLMELGWRSGRHEHLHQFQHLIISPSGDIKAVYTNGVICFDAHGHIVKEAGKEEA